MCASRLIIRELSKLEAKIRAVLSEAEVSTRD